MAIKVLYVDIRDNRQAMKSITIEWRKGMKASEVVILALGDNIGNQIINDLGKNDPDIIVAWHDKYVEKHSEIGGVVDFEWDILNESILTIVYENGNTSSYQVDVSSDWMVENSLIE